MTGRVFYDFTGIDMAGVMGLVHSHGGTDGKPSIADWTEFRRVQDAIGRAGGDPSVLRMYIIGPPHPPSTMHVYGEGDQNGDLGPEVIPDGEPC